MNSILPQTIESIEAAIDGESITDNADVSARIVKETVGLRVEIQVRTKDGFNRKVVENVATRSEAGKYISTLPQIMLEEYLYDTENRKNN
jgi:PDZ domain-containing secreted protein